MRRMGLVLALLVAAAPAWAAVNQSQALARLRQAAPDVGVLHVGGEIRSLYGTTFGYGASPEATAADFVTNHADIYGLSPDDLIPSELYDGNYTLPLMYQPDTGDYKFTLLTYQQTHNGLPVFRGELRLLVRNQEDYPLVLVKSHLVDLSGVGVLPMPATLAEGAAHAAAIAAVPGLTNFGPSELVVWAGVDGAKATPAIALKFSGDNGLAHTAFAQAWLFVADAATGAILHAESRILHTDVSGSVSGLATTGIKADPCADEVSTPMPYAYVNITGVSTTYANVLGLFTLPNPGTTAVTVNSPVRGQYFQVNGSTTLTQTVTPPGPANFLHNPANTETLRAHVNAYIQANVVRDFVLTYHPTYPTIATQTGMAINCNLTSGYCPGNAWYDGSALTLNFCLSGSGYPNTAYSSVVHHEFGHHVVQCGGSGQGAYGEGLGDCMAMLIGDDPVLGYGFTGNCSTGIRTAVNTLQYPCSGEIHTCGQLLSGAVWDTRLALAATNPATALAIVSSLTVNSVPLHGPISSIAPDITIDFLTLDDNDGNIYNGTPHYSEICAGFNAHSLTCPALQVGLKVEPNAAFDSFGDPGGPFTPASYNYTLRNLGTTPFNYQVTKTQPWLTLTNATGTVPGSGQVTVTVTVNAAANGLPVGNHNDTLTFTNLTDGAGNTTRTVTVRVGGPRPIYSWNLDTNPGWTTEALWGWGTPTGGSGDHGGPDPTSGYTGTKVYGYNLSGGYTNSMPERHLTTTAINCSNLTQTKLRFWRWLGVEQSAYDHAYVRISTNGTSWTNLWSNPNSTFTDTAWVLQEFDISAYADNRPTVYIRWTMGTTDSGWTYCGWNIDDIEIWGVPACTGASVTGQPQSQAVYAGSPVTFTVTAGGTAPFQYQWRKNGDTIDGALGASYTINAVTAGDAGSYTCTVTNACGNATSNAAVLTVYKRGDMNCDGVVNFDDIDAFVLALNGQAAYEAEYPDCRWQNADCNSDAAVNFDDIDAFVSLIGS